MTIGLLAAASHHDGASVGNAHSRRRAVYGCSGKRHVTCCGPRCFNHAAPAAATILALTESRGGHLRGSQGSILDEYAQREKPLLLTGELRQCIAAVAAAAVALATFPFASLTVACTNGHLCVTAYSHGNCKWVSSFKTVAHVLGKHRLAASHGTRRGANWQLHGSQVSIPDECPHSPISLLRGPDLRTRCHLLRRMQRLVLQRRYLHR